jgi:tetratricopeptide (TPR) repeat protein
VYRRLVEDEPWIAEWKKAGLKTEDFINIGETARKAEQYDEALHWYLWAARLEPDLGDPWYYRGQIYEEKAQWYQALDAYERAIEASHLRQVHRSSLYYRTGIIYHLQLETRQLDVAAMAYRAALEADDFKNKREAADCHYRGGEILRRQKNNPDEYIAKFQRAIVLNPKHVGAHMLLGLAIYERDKNAQVAETELLKAAELAPQSTRVYYHLGEIYRKEGHLDKAKTMYKHALELDPEFEAAQKQLSALEDK